VGIKGVPIVESLMYTSATLMRLFVAVTDKGWFKRLSSTPKVDEVNFWKPSPDASFKALQPGEILLFKLHAPDNFIVGGGFFTRFLHLPIKMAWEVFGIANGVSSLTEMRERVAYYRDVPIGPAENPSVGCIMLAEPFFWPQNAWIPVPADFSKNIVQGKGYESEKGSGRLLWEAVSERLQSVSNEKISDSPATIAAIDSKGFGKPQVVHPRLGQGLFRILVTEQYGRRCAVSGERTLPVLDATHIKPYTIVQKHELSNGLLMRSDLHRLFDDGYLSISPVSRQIAVSKRIKEEFENGRDYYKLEGTKVGVPIAPWARPSTENLEFHYNAVFLR
jgi:putative restriction endonuclease